MRALILVVLLVAGSQLGASAATATTFGTQDKIQSDPTASIPGRNALQMAMLTMQRTELTPAQRLQVAEPFFQQSIGASEEIDMGKVNVELRAIARQAANSSPTEREKLGPRAVELLETIKQPLQARLLFASVLQNTAAEIGDRTMNHRAINLLHSIESKDPGAKMDAVVQGCLIICQRQPLCSIVEQEALTLGKIEVEKTRAEKERKSAELDWRKIFGTLGDLLLGMVFCWGVSFLGKTVIKRFRHQGVH